MLLKDCPVGSYVRLVSFEGDTEWANDHSWWRGDFEVFWDGFGRYVLCNDGTRITQVDSDSYVFKIVSEPKTHAMTLTLSGKTYKLKPHTEPRLTVIDGVTYEMEEI